MRDRHAPPGQICGAARASGTGTARAARCRWRHDKLSHAIGFRGKRDHRSLKASGREDLQVEEPVACGDCASLARGTRAVGEGYGPFVVQRAGQHLIDVDE